MKVRTSINPNNVRLKDIQAIFCDIDGTLVDESGNLPQEVASAVRQIKDIVPFYLISGRCLESMLPIYHELNLTTPLITLNGALIALDDGRVLNEAVLPNELARKVITEVRKKFGPTGLLIYTENAWLTDDRSNPFIHQEEQIVHGESQTFTDLSELSTEKIVKILFMDEPIKIKIIDAFISENFPEFGSVISKPHFLELFSPFANKGRALYVIASNNNINLERCMCIGDGLADLPMYDIAGYKVAMGNAVKEVKRVANIQVPTNTDLGVEKVISALLKQK